MFSKEAGSQHSPYMVHKITIKQDFHCDVSVWGSHVQLYHHCGHRGGKEKEKSGIPVCCLCSMLSLFSTYISKSWDSSVAKVLVCAALQ